MAATSGRPRRREDTHRDEKKRVTRMGQRGKDAGVGGEFDFARHARGDHGSRGALFFRRARPEQRCRSSGVGQESGWAQRRVLCERGEGMGGGFREI
jgi:hypothetical protein